MAENSIRWPPARGHVEQSRDVGQEAHVGHVVGLVEHGDLDVGQRAGAALDQVEQPAGGGHDDVDATSESLDLATQRCATEDGDGLDADRVTEGLERLAHLHGELTGRHEDQGRAVLSDATTFR